MDAAEVLSDLKRGLNRPCPVCGANMGREVKSLSYGGLCCTSCRAFFRRCHQDSKEPNLTCPESGNCEVTSLSRQHCASCRRVACLRVGMRPEYVLTHEEKTRRFQKNKIRAVKEANLRQTISKTRGKPVAPAAENPVARLPEGRRDPRAGFCIGRQVADAALGRLTGETPPGHRHPTCCGGAESKTAQSDRHAEDGAYDGSLNCSTQSSESRLTLTNLEQSEEAMQLLGKILESNILDFKQTAIRHKASIPDQNDWTNLYSQNKKLWVNLIFAKFLSSANWEEKMAWLKPSEASTVNLHELERLGVGDFDSPTTHGLFGDDPVMQSVYLGFAQSLPGFCVDPRRHKDKVREVLLLHPGRLVLNASLGVHRAFLLAVQDLGKTVGRALSLLDINNSCQMLETMAELFQHSGLPRYLPEYFEDAGPSSAMLAFGVTADELTWAEHQKCNLLKTLGSSVPIGSEAIHELINYSMTGTPLSLNFAYQTARVYKERLWKLFEMHEEFKALNDGDRARIVLSAHGLYGVLMACITDDMPIRELARFGFSIQEATQDHFLNLVLQSPPDQCNAMQPIKMKKLYPFLPPEWHMPMARIQAFIKKEDGYKNFFIMLVCILFDPVLLACGASSDLRLRWRHLERVGRRYKMCLARQTGEEWARYEGRIHSTMRDLGVLASILDKIRALEEFGFYD